MTAGPALATWPPGGPGILAAWLDGVLTASGPETGSRWDDTPAMDILVFLTAIQETSDDVPLREQLRKHAADLAERAGLDATFFWPEKKIANTAERLASFGAIGGGEVTSLGRWAAARLLDKLAEPDEELTAAELIAYLADCDEAERDEDAWAWLDAQPDPAEAAAAPDGGRVDETPAALDRRRRGQAVARTGSAGVARDGRRARHGPCEIRPLHHGGRPRAGPR